MISYCIRFHLTYGTRKLTKITHKGKWAVKAVFSLNLEMSVINRPFKIKHKINSILPSKYFVSLHLISFYIVFINIKKFN